MKIAYTHNHSEFSNLRMLDCTVKIEALIDEAVRLGAKGIAITDHESLSGHIRAIQHIKEGYEKGIIEKDFKLMLGNEIYLVHEIAEEDGKKWCPGGYYHFILIAKDEVGHAQLRELSSLAWGNHFRTGKVERVPTCKRDLKRVVKSNPGHLIATTACIGGELGQCLLNDGQLNEYGQTADEQLETFLDFCLDLFGEDFYLEMQPSDQEEQILVNSKIVELSSQRKIPLIIATDTHYLTKDDREVHAAYLNSREDESRELGDFYATTYMMTPEEIHGYMDGRIGYEVVERAMGNTVEIAEKVESYDLYHSQIVPKATIPDFTLIEYFENAYEECEYIEKFAHSKDRYDRYLLHLIQEGWYEKEYNEHLSRDETRKMLLRINDELGAVWETSKKINDSVSSYYITALEIVNMMWDDSEDGGNSLVGPSRGSIAAFYTSYLIGLQQINPLKYNIPWWRHLHASRPEMPDSI